MQLDPGIDREATAPAGEEAHVTRQQHRATPWYRKEPRTTPALSTRQTLIIGLSGMYRVRPRAQLGSPDARGAMGQILSVQFTCTESEVGRAPW